MPPRFLPLFRGTLGRLAIIACLVLEAHDLRLRVHEPGELVLDEFAKLMHAHTIYLPKGACKACTKRSLLPRGTSH